jgi:3-hydroxybutyryl-CoA dehydrogenase
MMGHGIAQTSAQAGLTTYVYDNDEKSRDRGVARISEQVMGRVSKGKLTEEQAQKILGRIIPVSRFEEAKNADLVIEAVFEDLDLKREVFRALDKVMPDATIFASNTSALPISPMAAVTQRPDRFIGVHFHSPVVVMRLVEVIRGLRTSDETLEAVQGFLQRVQKSPVEVKKDSPGFITNRVYMPMFNEAVWTVYEGVATVEDVDQAMRDGFNFPMGPLQLGDFVGLDTMLHILEDLNEQCGGNKFIPCPLHRSLVASGYLGKKSGQGFYSYG